MDPGPILVTELRGDAPQAIHCGHAVLLDGRGDIVEAWGDPATPCHWRSAAKPLQAIPFAALAHDLGLTSKHIAVACGSHEAENDHVVAAREILAAAAVPESALGCAPHACDPRLAGPEPRGGWQAIHNNCSGKHAAMLAVCTERGWPLDTYLEPTHPLQQEILAIVAEAVGMPGEVPYAIDGCGVPTFILPVEDLARALQWLRRTHADVLDAMAAHPRMVGGTGRFDSDLIAATAGRVIAKIGAAGVHVALDRVTGAAWAVKLTSGASTPRDVLTGRVLAAAGWIDDARDDLADHLDPPIRNHAGRVVGRYA